MTRIYVTPRAGLMVRDPATMEYLPAEGAWKNDATAWRRLESDGDVSITKNAPAAAAPKKKES